MVAKEIYEMKKGIVKYLYCPDKKSPLGLRVDKEKMETHPPSFGYDKKAEKYYHHWYLERYVYKKKGPIREFSDDYLRSFTTKMTPEKCYKFAKAITLLGKSLSELKVEFKVPEDIPLLGIKKGKQNLQRFFYWNILKCFWNPAFDYKTNVMVNFDWYHPQLAFRYPPEEIKRWFKNEGLTIEHFNVTESGISCRGGEKVTNLL